MPQVLWRHIAHNTEPTHYRPPLWIIVPVLFLVIWFGVQIVSNVTESLRAIVGSVTETLPPPKR